MLIALTPEQEAWFKTHVVTGDEASIEAAALRLIDERIAELAAEELSRAEPRREALWVGELSDEDIEAIASTKMHPRHRHLDAELE
jgi:hypothetical protein